MLSEPLQWDTIDRVAPTLRPPGRTVMRQRWAELLFLHWTVPSEALQPFLPSCLTLDTFEGNAYVGLIPFTMTGIRPTWLPPFPPLSNFHEINVRTYVHFKGRDPGVWFFSLDAANAAAVRLARAWFKLPYHFARISLVKELQATEPPILTDRISTWSTMLLRPGSGPMISYRTERLWTEPTPARCSVRYTPCGPVTPAKVGTLEHFLAERYILYAYKNDVLYQGRVHHPPYPLQRADVHSLDENLVATAGIALPDMPPLAHYANEVHVRIYPLERVNEEG